MNVPILAEEYLSRLAELKKEMDECQIEIKLVYAKLTKYLAEGHLDYLKSSSGSITYKNKQYIPVKGRVVYDYSSDPDIAAKILHETIVAIAKPPGKLPTQLCAKLNRSSPTPAFSKIFDIIKNIGTANKIKLSATL